MTTEVCDGTTKEAVAGEIGLVPPAEFEASHWAKHNVTDYVETPVPTGARSK